MQYHEIANCFPLIQGRDFDDLCEDVKRNGLLQAILTFEDKILDGRNRFRACEVTGIPPRFVAFRGTWEEARATVVSLNLQRRNLTEAEKAIAGAKLRNLRKGDNQHTQVLGPIGPTSPVSARDAAEMMGVSEKGIKRASVVVRSVKMCNGRNRGCTFSGCDGLPKTSTMSTTTRRATSETTAGSSGT